MNSRKEFLHLIILSAVIFVLISFQNCSKFEVNQSSNLSKDSDFSLSSPSIKIISQPSDQKVLIGAELKLVIDVVGEGDVGYQWYLNSVKMAGQRSNELVIKSVSGDDIGEYFILVSDKNGDLKSQTFSVLTNYDPTKIIYGSRLVTEGNRNFLLGGSENEAIDYAYENLGPQFSLLESKLPETIAVNRCFVQIGDQFDHRLIFGNNVVKDSDCPNGDISRFEGRLGYMTERPIEFSSVTLYECFSESQFDTIHTLNQDDCKVDLGYSSPKIVGYVGEIIDFNK